MKSLLKVSALALAVVVLVACGGNDPTPTPELPTPTPMPAPTTEPTAVPTPTTEPTPEALEQPESPLGQPESPLAQPESPLAEPQTFVDPFAYCAAVVDVEVPDARYTGPDAPEIIALGLREVFETPETPLSYYQDSMLWRCMDGEVYACAVGANLPCAEQADPRDEPTEAMLLYCEENPESDFIPMVVTGRATIFQWSCEDGEPVAGEAVMTIDAQGFLADIWHLIDPAVLDLDAADLDAGAEDTETEAEDTETEDTEAEDTEAEE